MAHEGESLRPTAGPDEIAIALLSIATGVRFLAPADGVVHPFARDTVGHEACRQGGFVLSRQTFKPHSGRFLVNLCVRIRFRRRTNGKCDLVRYRFKV